nr:hypothetical protein [uncultured Pedobacter sp.]
MEETDFIKPHEFNLTTTTKVFYSICTIALLGFAVFTVSNGAIFRNQFLALFPIVLILGAILIVLNLRRKKVVITQTKIIYTNLFSTKELDIDDIKGYRIDSKSLKIVPKQAEDSSITIGNYFDFKGSKEIETWLRNNFQDQDAVDLETGLKGFLNDKTYGRSEDERNAKLKFSKELALAYNIWGGAFGFIFPFINQKFAFIVLLLIPLVGVALLFCSDLIKLSTIKSSIYPQIFIGFSIACAGLLIKNSGFNLLNLNKAWLPMIVFGLVILAFLYLKGINRSSSNLVSQIFIMVVLSAIYSFGCFITVNCVLDKSEPSLFKVAVLGKHISHGKSTSYYLRLNNWGPQQKICDERVSLKMFSNKHIGDFVTVSLKQGNLQAPWYLILKD